MPYWIHTIFFYFFYLYPYVLVGQTELEFQRVSEKKHVLLFKDQDSLGKTQNVNDVFFFKENFKNGIAVGNKGIIWITRDGGESWAMRQTSISSSFTKIVFSSEKYGWIVSENGKLFHTNNGGQGWKPVFIEGVSKLYTSFWFSDQIGWVAGSNGKVFRTRNRGESWDSQKVPISRTIKGIYFYNQAIGWVVGENGLIARTVDGGITWKDISLRGSKVLYNDVFFFDENVGIVIGDKGTVLKTTDGGNSWQEKAIGSNQPLKKLSSSGGNKIWLAGEKGTIFLSDDRGNSWQYADSLNVNKVNSIYAINQNVLWAATPNAKLIQYSYELFPTIDIVSPSIVEIGARVKISGSSFGKSSYKNGNAQIWINDLSIIPEVWSDTVILFSLPEVATKEKTFSVKLRVGKQYAVSASAFQIQSSESLRKTSWIISSFAENIGLNKVFFLNKQYGWLISDNGRIYRTVDGGKTWEYSQLQSRSPLMDIVFFNKSQGIVISADGVIYHTSNGGQLFKEIYRERNRVFSSLYFFNAKKGMIVGIKGYILKTEDAGKTWVRLKSVVSEDLVSIDFATEENGAIVGKKGTILITHNGGKSWKTVPSLIQEDLLSVYWKNRKEVWAVGEKGRILRSFDEGTTWEQFDINVESTFNDIKFVNELTACIVGDDGKMFKTKDNGQHWTQEYLPLKNDLKSAYYISEKFSWVVGKNGVNIKRIVKAPELLQVTPLVVSPSEIIFIRGKGFQETQGKSVVSIGEKAVTVRSWSDSAIKVIVPKLKPGKYPLRLVVNEEVVDFDGLLSVDLYGEQYKQDEMSFSYKLREHNQSFWGVHFLNRTIGWVVGNRGTLLRTSDGGLTWRAKNLNVTNALLDVTFASLQKGWVVGTDGIVFYTKDGGNVWTRQKTRTFGQLTSVFFLDEYLGWVVGENGILLKTVTSGEAWAKISFPYKDALSKVHFVNNDVGWIVSLDGNIFKTIDGGLTWTKNQKDTTQKKLKSKLLDVFFVNENKGYVVGENGTILLTTDAGKSWIKQRIGVTKKLFSVFFYDEMNGLIVGEKGLILKTNNSGKTWKTLENEKNNDFIDVFLTEKEMGWLVTKNGSIVNYMEPPSIFSISKKKGTSASRIEINGKRFGWYKNGFRLKFDTAEAPIIFWNNEKILAEVPVLSPGVYDISITYKNKTRYPSNFSFKVESFKKNKSGWQVIRKGRKNILIEKAFFTDKNNGWMFGTNATVLRTFNGGETWQEQNLPKSGPIVFASGHFSDTLNGILVGTYGSIYKTSDGGKKWRPINVQIFETLLDVGAIDEFAWAISKDGKFYWSKDKGDHWKTQSDVFPALNDSYFIDKSRGWIVGDEGSIFHSENGGKTWTKQPIKINTSLNAIFFIDKDIGWVIGDSGKVYKSLNSGKIWLPTKTEVFSRLTHMHFINEKTGWVVGENGVLIKTTNGGVSWVKLNSTTKRNIVYVFFENQLNGVIVTDYGEVFYTKDGGATWSYKMRDYFANLNRVYFITDKNGWAAGDGGVILKTTNGGNNWQPSFMGNSLSLKSIYFLNNNLGWSCGFDKEGNNVILKTSDGGNHWVRKRISDKIRVYDILFWSEKHGVVVGDGGTMLKTTDGGESWSRVFSKDLPLLRKAAIFKNNKVLAVGEDSAMILIKNNIPNVLAKNDLSNIKSTFTDIFFSDDKTAWLLGHNQKYSFIKRTVDSLKTWTTSRFPVKLKNMSNYQTPINSKYRLGKLKSLSFSTIKRGWAVGEYGSMIKTVDGGDQWESETRLTKYDLNSVFFIDESAGWAVGDHGVILKYLGPDIPKVFFLQPTKVKSGQPFQIVGRKLQRGVASYVTVAGQVAKVSKWGNNSLTVIAPQVEMSGWYYPKVKVRGSTDVITSKRPIFIQKQDIAQTKQMKWRYLPPSTRANLKKVEFGFSKRGKIVGESGVMFSTTNASDWFRLETGISKTLNSVYITPSKRTWVVGEKGLIFSLMPSFEYSKPKLNKQPTLDVFRDVAFLNGDNIGWAVGGREFIYRTNNEGKTWIKEFVGHAEELNTILFVDSKLGVAMGNKGVYIQTINGGRKWKVKKLSTISSIKDISFFDGFIRAICENGEVFTGKPSSTGITWSKSTNVPLENQKATSIAFADSYTGWAGTNKGQIFKTIDGANTWKQEILPKNIQGVSINSIEFLDIQNGWAVGDKGTILNYYAGKPNHEILSFQPSTVNITKDSIITVLGGGFGDEKHFSDYVRIGNTKSEVLNWSDQKIVVKLPVIPVGTYLLSVKRDGSEATSSIPLIVKSNELVSKGIWINQDHNIINNKSNILYAVDFLDDFTGWAVGANGKILKTENSGVSWQLKESSINEGLFDVDFVNQHRGWAVGRNGVAIKTVDGGSTWQKLKIFTPKNEYLTAVSFFDGVHGFFAGEKGVILTTSDAGVHCEVYKNYDDIYFHDVLRATKKLGFAVGTKGVLVKTEDGGETWQEDLLKDVQEDLSSISFTEDGTLLVVGRKGGLWISRDTAKTWKKNIIPKVSNITKALFVDIRTGWVLDLGSGFEKSRVLRTQDGGITWQNVGTFPSNSMLAIDLVKNKNIIGVGRSIWKYKESPEIEHLWPKKAIVSDIFWISGKNFGENISPIFLGGIEARISGWSDTLIRAEVPKVPTGLYSAQLKFNDEIVSSVEMLEVQANPSSYKDYWIESKLSPESQTIVDINVIDESNVYALGKKGTVFVTNSGFKRHRKVKTNLKQGLAITSYDKNFSCAVGWNGQISYTKDGWETHTDTLLSTYATLADVYLIDQDQAWIVGGNGIVYKTNSGVEAENWKQVLIRNADGVQLSSVYFINSLLGWIVGEKGLILKTEDGGTTWKKLKTDVEKTLSDVFFIDQERGWVVGQDGIVLSTLDGGDTWFKETLDENIWFKKVKFNNNGFGFVVGNFLGKDGVAFTSKTFGTFWEREYLDFEEGLYGVDFVSSTTSWIAKANAGILKRNEMPKISFFQKENSLITIEGENFTSKGKVLIGDSTLKTLEWEDNRIVAEISGLNLKPGAHTVSVKTFLGVAVADELIVVNPVKKLFAEAWIKGKLPTNKRLVATTFLDDKKGFVISARGEIFQTLDGGKTWQFYAWIDEEMKRDVWFNSVSFASPKIGWVCGNEGRVLKTTDAGKKWEEQRTGVWDWLNSIYASSDRLNVWAVGKHGLVIKSNDGGVTWEKVPILTKSHFSTIKFLPFKQDYGWISGQHGEIWTTKNRGQTWEQKNVSKDVWISNLYFEDENTGWAVGQKGSIFRTNDGGENWFNQITPTKNWVKGIELTSDEVLWITSADPINEGQIFKTFKSGEEWVLQAFEKNIGIHDVYFQVSKHGVAIADSGTVYEYTTVPEVTDVIPSRASYGEEIKILGKGFGFNSKLGISRIGNFVLAPSIWTDTMIKATIPPIPRGSYFISVTNDNSLSSISKKSILIDVDGKETDWYQQKTVSSEDLTDVSFATPYFGLVVGRNGSIMRTINGGALWESVFNFHNEHLFGVFMKDISSAWIVGEFGFIAKTKDGGITWEKQKSWTTYNLNAVFFIDKNYGWAVGDVGIILRTEDGGKNWKLTPNPTLNELYDVRFVNRNVGWAVGKSGVVLKTTDGGNKWARQITNTQKDLLSISLINSNRIWVSGNNGIILKTENSGINWDIRNSGTVVPLRSINFQTNRLGWAVGGNVLSGGRVFQTEDGGENWKPIIVKSKHLFRSCDFFSKTSGWAVGNNGTLFRYDTNVRFHQAFSFSPTVGSFQDTINILGVGFGNESLNGYVSFGSVRTSPLSWSDTLIKAVVPKVAHGKYSVSVIIDADTATLSNFFEVVPSINKATESWKAASAPNSPTLHDIHFVNEKHGWAVGSNGIVLKTVDRGETWEKSNIKNEWMHSVFFLDSANGWIVGYNGLVLKTSNAGRDWIHLDIGTREMLTSVFFLNPRKGWIVGGNGLVVRTIDGGKTWRRDTRIRTKANLSEITFSNKKIGWIVGDDGTLLKTVNAGRQWRSLANRIPIKKLDFTSVNFYNRKIGWIVGGRGTIFMTRDGGVRWNLQSLTANREKSKNITLRRIFFSSPQQGWAISGDVLSKGVIYKTTESGYRWRKVKEHNPFYDMHFINRKKGFVIGASSSLITYKRGNLPEILSVYPKEGYVGSKVRIVGSGFGNKEKTGQLRFNKSIASIQFWSDTLIEAIVPPSATGPHLINVVVGNNVTSSNKLFFIEAPDYQATELPWTKQKSPVSKSFKSVYFVDQIRGWIAGSGGTILRTIDGGQQWEKINTSFKADLLKVFFLPSGDKGWATGEKGMILKTLDSGKTWTRLIPHTEYYNTSKSFTDCYFLSENEGYLIASDGTLHYYNEGSWRVITTSEKNNTFNRFLITDPENRNGVIVGGNGRAYKINKGSDWTLLKTNVSAMLRNVFAYGKGEELMWAVGGDGFDKSIIMKTFDGGRTWIRQPSPIQDPLTSVFFVSEKIGWAVGFRGNILQTINGGTTWAKLDVKLYQNIQDIFFIKSNIGWLVGDNGMIYTYAKKRKNTAMSVKKLLPSSSLNVGTNFIIIGQNFGNVEGNVTVQGNPLKVVSWEDNKIIAIVPNLKADTYPIKISNSERTKVYTGKVLSIAPTVSQIATSPIIQPDLLQNIYYSEKKHEMNNTFFLNENLGWMVGSHGLILKTENGGASWQRQSSSVGTWLESVFFINNMEGWISGSNGTLLKTNNGGKQWYKIALPTSETLKQIVFRRKNVNEGWIIGTKGTIFHTRSKGKNWIKTKLVSRDNSINILDNLNSIRFISKDIGIIVGQNGLILKTEDNGKTWKKRSNHRLWATDLYSVSFPTPRRGWAVGDNGTVLVSLDMGNTWKQAKNVDYSLKIKQIHFESERNGWMIGDAVLKTVDGGKTWTQLTPPLTTTFNTMTFISPDRAIIGAEQGKILMYNDIAASWIKVSVPTRVHLNDVFFLNKNVGWLAGEKGIVLRTLDGGKTWKGKKIRSNVSFKKLFFLNKKEGWVVGSRGSIFKTENGGKDWENKIFSNGSDYTGLYFVSGNKGFLIDRKKLLFTKNSGKEWRIILELQSPIIHLQFFDSQYGKLITQNGVVLSTSNGGKTWLNVKWDLQNYESETEYKNKLISLVGKILERKVNDVLFTAKKKGWAATSRGEIFYTENNGEKWKKIHQKRDASFTSFFSYRKDKRLEIWCVGTNNTVLRTKDGINWDSYDINQNNRLNVKNILVYKYKNKKRIWASTQNQGFHELYTYTDSGWVYKRTVPSPVSKLENPEEDHLLIIFNNNNGIKTLNQGLTWEDVLQTVSIKPVFTPKQDLTKAYFFNAKEGVAIGEFGEAFHSLDSARTWRQLDNRTINTLNDIVFNKDGHGKIAGGIELNIPLGKKNQWGAMIQSSSDGGKTWNFELVEQNGKLNAVTYDNSANAQNNVAWAVGNDGLVLKQMLPQQKQEAVQTLFTIKGKNFGSEPGQLMFKGKPLFISKWTPTEIVAVYPEAEDSLSELIINVDAQMSTLGGIFTSKVKKQIIDFETQLTN